MFTLFFFLVLQLPRVRASRVIESGIYCCFLVPSVNNGASIDLFKPYYTRGEKGHMLLYPAEKEFYFTMNNSNLLNHIYYLLAHTFNFILKYTD